MRDGEEREELAQLCWEKNDTEGEFDELVVFSRHVRQCRSEKGRDLHVSPTASA